MINCFLVTYLTLWRIFYFFLKENVSLSAWSLFGFGETSLSKDLKTGETQLRSWSELKEKNALISKTKENAVYETE